MEALDAIDTGVEQAPEGVELLYHDSTGLASRVGRLNPRWNEIDETTGQAPSPDERFEQAIDMAAMRSGASETDAYLEEWRRDVSSVEGDLAQIADETARAK